MSTVLRVLVDVDDDKSGDGKLGDDLHELSASFCATAMPMKLGFTDAQTVHGLAHLIDVVVVAQNGREQVCARI